MILVVFLFLCLGCVIIIFVVLVLVLLIGMFVVMYLCGFSFNNFLLMVFIIVIGFVVDDVIVVLENIVCYLEVGMKLL